MSVSIDVCANPFRVLRTLITQAVCGESTIKGVCHKASATLSEAINICSDVGARLCTVAEVEANAVAATGCNIDSSLVWTSTPCDDGSGGDGVFTRNGRWYEGQRAECTTDSELKLSVRCCADPAAQTTVTTSVSTTAPVTMQVVSTSLCADLGWSFKYVGLLRAEGGGCHERLGDQRFIYALVSISLSLSLSLSHTHTHTHTHWHRYGNVDVCGMSPIDGTCNNNIQHATANAICVNAGARLCTLAEVQANAAASTGCGFDSKLVWTSTPCGVDSMFATMGKYDFNSAPQCLSLTDNTVSATRCCADRVDTTAVVVPEEAWDGIPAAGTLSVKSCTELSWKFMYGNNVCGASAINGVCHKTSKTFNEAVDVCSAVGARLCTAAEVEANAVAATGCAIDSLLVWTSTPCSDTDGASGVLVRTLPFFIYARRVMIAPRVC